MTDSRYLHAQLIDAFNGRAWDRVSALSMPLLAACPDDADLHFIAGTAALERRELRPALRHLNRAFELAPHRAEFPANLARALSTAGESRRAKEFADVAWACAPSNPATLDILGNVYSECSAHTMALLAFERAVALAPRRAPLRYNLATSFVSVGDIARAGSEIETCLLCDPYHWRSHLALSHLATQTPTKNHLARLSTLLASHAEDIEARICLHLALAKEHEDIGNFTKSFEHLFQGKQLAGSALRHQAGQDIAVFDAIKRIDSTVKPGRGHDSTEPIFVFGMPRTGTTLVERILSSHPDVTSAGELREFGIAIRKVCGAELLAASHDAVTARISSIDWQQLGEIYLNSTRHVTGHTPHFIDKFTHNFLYAGFIARTFPNARLVCLRRNPIDTCLSNFRQLFSRKLPYYNYSFDLADTGNYFVLFDGLMAYWRRHLPGRILEVDYEDLVHAQRATTRTIIDFCGLPWHEDCLDFQANASPVATASSVEVRTAMYTSAVRRWHKYKPQLTELLSILERAGIMID
jgi:tetratricopeptide (TPR) repeat protein